jgi:hypothetical protein
MKLFDLVWVRFAVSGTLILCFVIADRLASRGRPSRSHGATPRWVTPVMWVSIGAYYLLIRPTGGNLLGGAGNLAGVGLCLASFVMRSARDVRYPELGSRGLFYLALPIAVGVPWGLVVLSAPALGASVVCCRRADRLLNLSVPARAEGRFRMVQGIW